MTDIEEKIAKAEEEIRQLQNRKRKLLNQKKDAERKARTHLYTLTGVCALPRAFISVPLIQGSYSPLREFHSLPLVYFTPDDTLLRSLSSAMKSEYAARKEVDSVAIYHCSIKIISRGKGKSAVAAAAYRSGETLTNHYDGVTHDFTRKGGIVHTEILLPPHARRSLQTVLPYGTAWRKPRKRRTHSLQGRLRLLCPQNLTGNSRYSLFRSM